MCACAVYFQYIKIASCSCPPDLSPEAHYSCACPESHMWARVNVFYLVSLAFPWTGTACTTAYSHPMGCCSQLSCSEAIRKSYVRQVTWALLGSLHTCGNNGETVLGLDKPQSSLPPLVNLPQKSPGQPVIERSYYVGQTNISDIDNYVVLSSCKDRAREYFLRAKQTIYVDITVH